MSFTAALVLGGSIIYAFVPGNAGALMIAAGIALEVVRLLYRYTAWWSAGTKGKSA